jgi:hypothetical protein
MSLSRMASVDYLVDHVATGDGRPTDPGASALTRYYTAEGYPPGTWLGSGMAALDAADMTGSEVTEEQLRALFEGARNPFTGERLGRPTAKYPTRQERIDRRVGKLPDTLTADARAALIEKITTEEKETRTRTAVAGFDLTFSVPKSVSAMWALAPADVQEQLYLAHRAALAATLELIEAEAVFTRLGRNGVRRVRTTGLVAARVRPLGLPQGRPSAAHPRHRRKPRPRPGRQVAHPGLGHPAQGRGRLLRDLRRTAGRRGDPPHRPDLGSSRTPAGQQPKGRP